MSIFYLPDLGEGLTEAEIRTWYVKEGDTVSVDQVLVAMETAKAVVDVPSPVAGKISKLFGKENAMIATGAPLIEFASSVANSIELPQSKHSVVGSLEESDRQWEEMSNDAASQVITAIKALPAARAFAQQHHIDLNQVPASASGFITKNDVERYFHQKLKPDKLSLNNTTTEILHGVKRSMALAMTQSQRHIVPVTIIEDVEFARIPSQFDITVAFIQSIAHAAKSEPSLNAWFDDTTFEKKIFAEVHLGIAVDATEGLFVPVIKNVLSLPATLLRNTLNQYKSAAQERKLSPDQLQGATLTLSNFGSIAGKYANPIVIPPTVAIIGIGKIRAAAIVKSNTVIAGNLLPVSLAFDHRAVTGGEATRFLAALIAHFLQIIDTHS